MADHPPQPAPQPGAAPQPQPNQQTPPLGPGNVKPLGDAPAPAGQPVQGQEMSGAVDKDGKPIPRGGPAGGEVHPFFGPQPERGMTR